MLIGYENNSFKFCNCVAMQHIMLIHTGTSPGGIFFWSRFDSYCNIYFWQWDNSLRISTPCYIGLFRRTLQIHDSGIVVCLLTVLCVVR